MKCKPRCINSVNITPIDAHTVEIRCAIHGATYLFKNEDGTLETADDRKKRMAQYRICENPECGAEYQIKDHPYYIHLGKTHCPTCVAAYLGDKLKRAPWVRTSKHDTTWSRYGISR